MATGLPRSPGASGLAARRPLGEGDRDEVDEGAHPRGHLVVLRVDRVDVRVGRITRAEPYPEARKPAIKLWIDFGPGIGEKRSSAQITVHYEPERLVGQEVLAVVNFPPRQIGKFVSEVLVLGLPYENGDVVLIRPDMTVPNGARMY